MFCYGLLALLDFCHCLFFVVMIVFAEILNFSDLLCSKIIWKLENVFVKIVNYICLFPLSLRQAGWYDCVSVLTQRRSGLKIEKQSICMNFKLYLSRFVLIFLHRWLCVRSDLKATDAAPLCLPASQTTSTWPSCKLYLSKVDNVFVNIALSICQDC